MRHVDKRQKACLGDKEMTLLTEVTNLHKDNSSHWEMKLEVDARACPRNCESSKQKTRLMQTVGKL